MLELKVLLVIATLGQKRRAQQSHRRSCDLSHKGKRQRLISTSSFKPFVKVVNWANCRTLRVQVLDKTGHKAPSAKHDSGSQAISLNLVCTNESAYGESSPERQPASEPTL